MATGDSQARIRITAQDETQRAFASAGRGLQQLEAAAGSAVAGFAALAPAIAAAFAVDALRGSIALLDSLNDISDATGASIESLGKLEGAARKNGATMEDVGAILVKFNAALNSATPDSPLAKALQSIGLNAKDLRQQDPAEALLKVSQALAGFTDDGNKARLVQELFGKSVQKAGPFLKDLAENLAATQPGLVEGAKQAEAFNKKLAELSYNSELATRSLVERALPALNEFAQGVKDWTEKSGWEKFKDALSFLSSSPIKAIGKGLLGDLPTQSEADRLRNIIVGLENLQQRDPDNAANNRQLARLREELKAYEAIENEVNRLRGAQSGAKITGPATAPLGKIGDLAGTPKATAEKLFVGPEIPQATLDAIKALGGTDTAKIKELRDTLGQLLSIRAASGGGNVDEAILSLEEALQKFDPAAKAAAEAQDELNRLLAATPSGQVEAYQKQIELLADALEKTADPQTARKIREALDAVNKSIEGIGKEGEQSLDKLSTFAEEASRNIQDALGDTIEQALSGHFDNIGQLWLSLLNKLVAQAIAANLGEALFGKGGAGSGGGLVGDFFKSFFGGARADGGPVSAGRTYLVGERGPELFTPSVSGGIVPNSAMASAGGGGTTINVAAGPTKGEVLSAIQLAVRASEAKTDQRLRRAGI